MTKTRVNANLTLLLSLGGLSLLYKFPPNENSLYPACPFYRYLHLYCPGCGATRALSALLHGRVAEAMHYNPLMVALLPFFLAFGACAYWSAMTRDDLRWPEVPKPALALLVAVVMVFAAVRNV